MLYLILGASGQVGSALCDHYFEKGDSIETFDIASAPHEDLRLKSNSILRKKFERSDFVFFLAFDVGGSRYLKKYQKSFDFLQNNMKIMVNTFELLKETKKPFIFTSSQMSNMHFSSYGTLKRLGEHYTESLGGLVVKFWNVYGIETNLEKSHVITDFIIKARDKGVINMLTDGDEFRQFLHVEDCCRCLDILSQKYATLDRKENYHISSFQTHCVHGVASLVAKNFPHTVPVIKGEARDCVQGGGQSESPDRYILNFWEPKISLKEGIKRMYDYYV